jgi:hypothetical protein
MSKEKQTIGLCFAEFSTIKDKGYIRDARQSLYISSKSLWH